MQSNIEIKIPFSGFYETIHSNDIDRHFEWLYNLDDDPEIDWYDQLQPGEYKKAEIEYCKQYTQLFSELVDVPMTFKEMTSPREYNFSTDRIFCNMNADELTKIKNRLDHDKMTELVKRKFTSCDGFMSFYSNSYDEWLNQSEPWDHNQISTALECLADEADPEWRLYIGEDIELC